MATKPKMKEAMTVKVADLIPPFRVGEWVTVVNVDSLQYLPSTPGELIKRHVIQLDEAAVYVGSKCESGWLLLGIDSGHFRLASVADMEREARRFSTNITLLNNALIDLRGVIEEWNRRGLT